MFSYSKMILEAFGVKKLKDKINKVKEHDDSPETSDMSPVERTTLVVEIIFASILYVIILVLMIFSIVYAFNNDDAVWGVLIIFFGLPMSLIYLLILMMRNDKSFRRLRLS
jgi:hypothetical protein